MRLSILFVGLWVSSTVFAASPYKQSLTLKKNDYVRDGVFIGGKASEGTSLLAVRRAYSSKMRVERVIVDLGDKDLRPSGLKPGYFQVSMDAANNRVVMDLAQLRLSKVSESQLQNMFINSPYVASVALTLDPEDKAATMVLKLKRPMKLEVFQLLNKKKPGRVVMDLTPLTASAASAPAAKKARR